ncbi:MAG: hypothetical protein ACK5P5_05235 [Pseudobdellovibrionaceae bacterium]
MKVLSFFSVALIFYFVYGFYVSQLNFQVYPETIKTESNSKYYDYRGVINAHTRESIGSGTIQQVVLAAQNAKLDFLMLTDLNHFETTVEDFYANNLLLLVGGKYSYLDSRLIHYAAGESLSLLGDGDSISNTSLGANLGEVQLQLSDILTKKTQENQGSLTLLAHPYKTGFDWAGEIAQGMDGLEILNIKSLAFRAWEFSKISVLWSLIIYPFQPKLAFIRLFSEPSEEINTWDKISQTRKFFAYAGAEASARAVPWSNYLLRFPSYQRSFEMFTNHVLLTSELTGQLQNDKQKIFQALKQGSFYTSFDMIGNPKGFYAEIESGSKTYTMGSQVPLTPGMKLKIKLPKEIQDFYEVVIYRNGQREKTFNKLESEYAILQPGSYRVQVRISLYFPVPDAKKWVTWIYSNPFFVSE